MNCRETTALSPLYHSGELDARNAATFTAHLQACPACAREIQRQSLLDSQLRKALLAEDLPTDAIERRVLDRIAAAAAPQAAARPALFQRWALAGMAAAAVLLAAVGYLGLLARRPAPVYADAVQDHQDEVVDHQPRKWRFDLPAIEALAVRELVPPADVLALAAHGYRLQRGKICRLDGQLYLHLVYDNGANQISVFLRQRNPSPLPGRPRAVANGLPLFTAHMGREHVAGFNTSRLTALVVTTQSNESALDFASFASGVL
ncbi:MAG TPA: zf-HC2 domain-containing protein [Candidatus Acidoferrales bacterium]|nr:zf-HC2 domain-containing protein [Candidatus Acidoferrales bacterium]